MLTVNDVPIGSYWRRKKTGVVYEVTGQNGEDVCLTPVRVPPGKRARETWKWCKRVLFDMERVEKPEVTQ